MACERVACYQGTNKAKLLSSHCDDVIEETSPQALLVGSPFLSSDYLKPYRCLSLPRLFQALIQPVIGRLRLGDDTR